MPYIQTFASDNNPSTLSLSGTYVFSNGVVVVPSGSTVPAPTLDASIFWVPPSGALCIASGTSWLVFTLT